MLDQHDIRQWTERLDRIGGHGLFDWNDWQDNGRMFGTLLSETDNRPVSLIRKLAKHFGAAKVPTDRIGALKALGNAYYGAARKNPYVSESEWAKCRASGSTDSGRLPPLRRVNPKQRDLHFAGYDFVSGPKGTTIHRERVDFDKAGDYGADPLGDGTFRMVPSGDIVDWDERQRRLKRNPGAKRNPEEAALSDFPKGTELKGGYYDYETLSIWGDRMAVVRGPSWRSFHEKVHEGDFDPRFIARRYEVSFTDLKADPKFVGRKIYFKFGDQSMYEQDFSVLESGYRYIQGRLDPPISFWVEVKKLGDLTDGEDGSLQRYLESNGYKNPRRYPLSAAKWRKLLKLSFEETQEQDWELANAVDDIAYDANSWEGIGGIFATGKKGGVKWVITRNPKGTGL